MEKQYEISQKISQSENDRFDRFNVRTLRNPVSECHFHSQIELLYVESGSIAVTVGESECILGTGGLAAVGSFELHSVRAVTESIVKVVSISVRKIADFQAVFRNKTFGRPFCEDDHSEFGQLIERLEAATESSKGLAAKGYAYILIDKAIELLGTAVISEKIGVAREMLSYMDEHFTENLSLEQIAADLGYNRDYLSRVFSSTVGGGFCRYLNLMRVNYAVQLITTTELSAERISDMSGFGSVHSFYNSFRDVCRCTPGQYRKRHAKKEFCGVGMVSTEIHPSDRLI